MVRMMGGVVDGWVDGRVQSQGRPLVRQPAILTL